MSRLLFIAALTSILLSPLDTTACDWYRSMDGEGEPLHWHKFEIPYWVDDSHLEMLEGEREYEIIREAMEQWNSLDTPFAFVYMGKTPNAQWYFDDQNLEANENHIVFVHHSWAGQVDWEYESAIALTTLSYNTGTGELIDADMRINNEQYLFADCAAAGPEEQVYTDLLYVILHETGHMTGLDHSEDLLSVMAVQDANCSDEPPHLLLPDDKECFLDFYGSDEYIQLATPPEPEPELTPDVVGGDTANPEPAIEGERPRPDWWGCASGGAPGRTAAPMLLLGALLVLVGLLRRLPVSLLLRRNSA